MLTDRFTIIVQAINFLILVGLLSKFLFTPIIRAMDKREADIADTLSRAEEKERRVSEAEEGLARKHSLIAAERETVLTQARQQAELLEKELSDQARQRVDQARIRWEQDLRQHQGRFLDMAAAAVSEQVLQSSDRVLRDLSGRGLEQAVLDRFLERIQSENETALLSPGSSGELALRTTFPLPPHSRERAEKTLRALFPGISKISFAASLRGSAGIELACGNRRIAWSIEDHLETVRTELNGLLTMDEHPS